MAAASGAPGELIERLVDLVEAPDPHLRAVLITLLIKALDDPAAEPGLIEAMVTSDDAAAMIDPVAAAASALRLRSGLTARLTEMAADHGEARTVVAMRDHLLGQTERWASTAVDDADNRRRAERFLAWAERPGELEAAQRRGIFVGLDAEDFRRLAAARVAAPVSAESALGVWAAVERWRTLAEEAIGDATIEAWSAAGPGGDR